MRLALAAATMLTVVTAHTAAGQELPDELVTEAERAGVAPLDLAGALGSEADAGHDVTPCEYLWLNGEVPGCIGSALAVTRQTEPGYRVWDRIAECESNGNWAANTGNGYYGGLQFDLGSWRAAGGRGMPHQASRTTQIAVAERWLSLTSWRSWPVCSRRLGLR